MLCGRPKGRVSSETPPPAGSISFNQDQVGTRYGWVTILTAERRYVYLGCKGGCYVNVKCNGCGRVSWVYLGSLRRGVSKGCQACSQPRRIPKWLDRRLTDAKLRCQNPKHHVYASYGGRGIEFRFTSVLEAGLWVQENLGLHRDLEIDRIDVNSHYEPGNIRWATEHQQQANKRSSKIAENWVFRQEEWPYAYNTVHRKLLEGHSREEIIQQAHDAVAETRKGWRVIAGRLQSMTSSTLDPITGLPCQESSSTTASR